MRHMCVGWSFCEVAERERVLYGSFGPPPCCDAWEEERGEGTHYCVGFNIAQLVFFRERQVLHL